MAGRPLRKAKLAALGASPSATERTTFDPATRAHVVKRAAEIGDRRAAEEAGCSPNTLRSWRRRARLAASGVGSQGSPALAVGVVHGEGQEDRADDLRRRADAARQAEARALRKVDSLLRSGLANEARAASSVARDRHTHAQQLERAAQDEAEHRARISETQGALLAKTMAVYFRALTLPDPWGGPDGPAADLFGHLLREGASGGDRLTPPADLVAQAKEQVVGGLRRRIQAELRAQQAPEDDAEDPEATPHAQSTGRGSARRGQNYLDLDPGGSGGVSNPPVPFTESCNAPTDAEDDPEPNDGLIAWADLPPEWKQHTDRAWARWEYTQQHRREEIARESSTNGPPRRSKFDVARWRVSSGPDIARGEGTR